LSKLFLRCYWPVRGTTVIRVVNVLPEKAGISLEPAGIALCRDDTPALAQEG